MTTEISKAWMVKVYSGNIGYSGILTGWDSLSTFFEGLKITTLEGNRMASLREMPREFHAAVEKIIKENEVVK